MAGALHLPKLRMPFVPGFSGDADDDYVDVFEEMTLAEHLDELRSRLVKTCIGIGLAFIVGLFLTRPLLAVVRDNANVERFDVINATEPNTAANVSKSSTDMSVLDLHDFADAVTAEQL